MSHVTKKLSNFEVNTSDNQNKEQGPETELIVDSDVSDFVEKQVAVRSVAVSQFAIDSWRQVGGRFETANRKKD